MPLIDVRLVAGAFSADERRHLSEGLVDAVVAVKGASIRAETEVLIAEVPGNGSYRNGAGSSPEGAATTSST